MTQPLRSWIFQRNASYLDSARIALTIGLWWFPTSLVRNLKPSAVDLVIALLTILVGVPLIVLCHVAFIGAGLLGFLTEIEADDAPTESRRKAQ